jgi:hypothetical protein
MSFYFVPVDKKEDLEEWVWNLAADIAIRPVGAAWVLNRYCEMSSYTDLFTYSRLADRSTSEDRLKVSFLDQLLWY